MEDIDYVVNLPETALQLGCISVGCPLRQTHLSTPADTSLGQIEWNVGN
jgi:hypothetical protein